MSGFKYKIGHLALHFGEEPIISGSRGSGTVFFSGCNMHCVFCQNYPISQQKKGTVLSEQQLTEGILSLQSQGAHNINLVSPSHYIIPLIDLLTKIKDKLHIPVVYNTSGFDSQENLVKLENLVDIFLTDIKYFDEKYALKYSKTKDYCITARRAFETMKKLQPKDIIEGGIMKKGVIVRYLALPNLLEDGKKVLDFIAQRDKNTIVSIMSQYTPCGQANQYAEINCPVPARQYDKLCDYAVSLGLENAFVQSTDSATTEYIPSFNLI